MLKEHAEAAAQELSRKKIETSEVREKSAVPENQRNKKSEECQGDVEKIQMKNKKDEDLHWIFDSFVSERSKLVWFSNWKHR